MPERRMMVDKNQLSIMDGSLFISLLNHVDDCAIIGLTAEGIIVAWGMGAERLFGLTSEQVIGERLPRAYANEKYESECTNQNLALAAERGDYAWESWRKRWDGVVFWGRGRVVASNRPGQDIDSFLVTVYDDTKRKHITDALRKQAHIIDQLHEAVISVDLDGYVTSWNQGAERLFQYSAIRTIGHHIGIIYQEQDRGLVQSKVIAPTVANGSLELEVIRRKESGELANVRLNLSVLRDDCGIAIGVAGCALDITKRKQLETKLRLERAQLQSLTSRLTETQELERRRLAGMLHDLTGQQLTALSINLGILRRQAVGGITAEFSKRLGDSSSLVEAVGQSVRGVMTDLHPPLLDQSGLVAALRFYSQEFSERTGVAVKVIGKDPSPRLAPVIEGMLFRIAQEALTNVAKHSHATNVEIALQREFSEIRLSIVDDGCGFDTSVTRVRSKNGGWGVTYMHEYALTIGSYLTVESTPGHGTRVSVSVPVSVQRTQQVPAQRKRAV